MNRRLPLLLFITLGFCVSGNAAVGSIGQPAPTRDPKVLAVRTQLRPVGKKATETLWFAPGNYWTDDWEGGVQSGTLDETVELQIWNTTKRLTFGPGFIRFERTAGGVKEGTLVAKANLCVVNTARPSSLSLEFMPAPATVEFGYDGCVMKGTLANDETLRMWNETSQLFKAGTQVEFNGAGLVTRGVAGPGTSGAATPFDGVYTGTCTLACPEGVWWVDVGRSTKTVPFKFTAKGGVFEGGGDDLPYSLKWRGDFDSKTGAITKGSVTGWIDFDHPRYRPRDYAHPEPCKESKLRWTVTGPVSGTLAPPATGRFTTNTSTDVPSPPSCPEPWLREPIVCECAWAAVKGTEVGPIEPTTEGTTILSKAGRAGALDLIFVIDQTSSMSPVFAEVQKTAKGILSTISGAFPDFRVAIVAYRDWSDGDKIFVDVPFTNDAGAIQAAIDNLKAEGGGDTPEAVLEAVLRALRMPWRAGVNKQIILMGDAPPHSPIPDGPDKGKTADDVIRLAYAVDPAVINAIVTSVGGAISKDTSAAFEDLAKRSGGTMVTADKAEEVPKKIMDVVRDFKPAETGGGGGGAPVLPSTGISAPMVAAGVLGLGALLLLAGIVVLARRRGAAAGGPAAAAPPALRVSAGLSITLASGALLDYRITGPRTTIGRAPDNALVLNDGEMSSHHAEILASRDGFRLRDVGSSNGTTLNGEAVTDAYLGVGDEIGMGTTRLILTE
jgi:LPXTG-motif cell wall-anchored protein